MDQKEIRCISIAEDAKRQFAYDPYEGELVRRFYKIACLLEVLNAAIEYDEGEGEVLVVPAAEMAQLLREAMEVKERK